jgi:hypothetical protein
MMTHITSFTLLWFFFFVPMVRGAIQLELLGQVTMPTGLMYKNTEVGGLSGISYYPQENIFYVLSDDRSFRQSARFYRFAIDISRVQVSDLSVDIRGVTSLENDEGKIFTAGSLDPEGIAVTENGNLYISSEGVARKNIPPFVALYNPAGKQLKMMNVPKSFFPVPDGSQGVRDNMGFEALTLSADGRYLTAAPENALVQDGIQATLERGSPCRLVVFDTVSGEAVYEYVYHADPVPEAPVVADGLHVNGLVELLALEGRGSYLALERAFADGKGSNIRLYHAVAVNKNNSDKPETLSKDLILNFDTLGIPLDNLEGMSFGPNLADGRRSLVVISDNNFSRVQFTQVLVFAVQQGN